jgi:hypothetical protein
MGAMWKTCDTKSKQQCATGNHQPGPLFSISLGPSIFYCALWDGGTPLYSPLLSISLILSFCLCPQVFRVLDTNATSFTAKRNIQVQWPPNSTALVSVICDDSKTAGACCSSSSFHLADPEVAGNAPYFF